MTKHLCYVLLNVLFLYSSALPKNYAIPEQWDQTLQEHLAVLRMSSSCEKRIADLCGLFARISAIDDVTFEQKLALVNDVRESLVLQLREDLHDLRHYLKDNPDDQLAHEKIKALYAFAPCLHSFSLTSNAGLEKAVKNLSEMYDNLPAHLHYIPESIAQPLNPATHKIKRRKGNTTNVIIGGIAGLIGVGMMVTLLLKAQSKKKTETTSDSDGTQKIIIAVKQSEQSANQSSQIPPPRRHQYTIEIQCNKHSTHKSPWRI